ncbi:MAG: beta-N-acetylhexosaminidase [Clostridia bacterium]|nr:beta-N-acetylhexosaminidase [Clostridia bacterium]
MKLNFLNLPADLAAPLSEVSDRYEVSGSGTLSVSVSSCECGFTVEKDGDGLKLSYAKKKDFFRALSFLNQVWTTGESVCQNAAFSTLCYMADVSRNAVLSMDGARRMIRYLALMGYDSMMLYAEDTFEIPEYPYFGHMRGRYTCEELRELDDYADSFGIELIPCVQTLAHLKSALRWDCFASFIDTDDILLVNEPKTYEFIDKMLKAIASCFRSKRVHIGMDEAHNLGLGKYLDRNGYQNRFDILSGHLAKVKEMCDGYGLEPMIWSDMYFRLFNHGGYYMKEGKLPAEIVEKVPKGVGLVYWDYYTENLEILDNMFENHKLFGNLIFAGGAWKWTGYAPCTRISNRRCFIHADACLRHGCNDVIVTGWGDNGADASQFSILPSLLIYAEKCFNTSADEDAVSARFNAVFGIEMDAFLKMDLVEDVLGAVDKIANPGKYLLFNGVLGGLFDSHVPEKASAHYLNAAKELLQYADHPEFGYLFATLGSLCHVLEKKASLSVDLRKAYKDGKRDVLRWYAEKEIPEVISRIDDFLVLLRQQWYTENKTFGFDVQEVRLGGLKETLRSAAVRLKSYCNEEVSAIEELEQPVLPVKADGDGNPRDVFSFNNWSYIATASKLGY